MTGLERYDSSFIYCSQATKDVGFSAFFQMADLKLVLRLQTKRDRLNLAQGMIERKICTYANLQYKRDLLVIFLFSVGWLFSAEALTSEHPDMDWSREFVAAGDFTWCKSPVLAIVDDARLIIVREQQCVSLSIRW